MEARQYLSAREAAAELGVRLETLYAYVSRGLLHSQAGGGAGRARRYLAEEVRRLKARREQRRDPEGAVEEALHWGAPVLESAITLIRDGRLYYRGRDALVLAESARVEQVATLIWTGAWSDGMTALFNGPAPEMTPRCRDVLPRLLALSPLERCQVGLPLLAADDPAAYDLRPEAVAQTGARLLRQLAVLVALSPGAARGEGEVVRTLQRGWGCDAVGQGDLLRAALILCADHELNVSAFAARCVASAGASPYAVLLAGLAALQGTRHGGATERAAQFVADVQAAGDPRAVMARWLRRGEPVPGFGHRLYPGGDPRGRALLDQCATVAAPSETTRLLTAIRDAGADVLGQGPNLDMGLAEVAHVLALPPGAALGLFALGRAIGWIGHAIEQYADGRLIRPRARYVGSMPPHAGSGEGTAA